MEINEHERQDLQADTTEQRSFDELAKRFADGTTSREQLLKWLGRTLLGGGALTLLPSMAEAGAHKTGQAGKRGKHHGGGGGGGACPAPCPDGALTVKPTAHKECRCVAASPGLRDPAFACGERVNATGDACCFCLYTTEGEGFCAISSNCDTITAGSVTECTSGDECPPTRKCVVTNPFFGDIHPAAGVCWPECNADDPGVTPVLN